MPGGSRPPLAAGNTAVVTGAASGIGRALAAAFRAEGMNVVLADVEEGPLRDAVDTLGEGAFGVPTDVSQADAVDALAAAAAERFGSVDVVCNNAGVGGNRFSTWETPLPYWEWVLSVNLWGVVHGIRSFVPLMIEQGSGHVVNTASIAGLLAIPQLAPYVATKHAVVGISETLFHELQGTGVGVTVVCPGGVITRFGEAARNWPARLGPPPATSDAPDARQMRELLAKGGPGISSPERVADLVVDAVRTNRFMVLTEDQIGPSAVGSLANAIAGGPPTARPIRAQGPDKLGP